MPGQRRDLTEDDLLDALAVALEEHATARQNQEVPEAELRKGLTFRELVDAMARRGLTRSDSWWHQRLHELVETGALAWDKSVRYSLIGGKRYRPPVYRVAENQEDD